MHQPADRKPVAAPAPGPPPGGTTSVTIGVYASYPEAERAVDHLSDQRFPVEHTAIVGRGPTSFEQVTGRLTGWSATGRSALAAAVPGALAGWVFGVFDWMNPVIPAFSLALYGAVFGALVGGAFGFVVHTMSGGQRDFTSVPGMRAESYAVEVAADHADRAARLLEEPGAPGRGAA